ncbi:MAG: hypothetical protein QOE70_1332 [Chthoniobacter sp.]|jgi:hypothetical protein|nr:hypothetical protein [Chthoniobacter sp.]
MPNPNEPLTGSAHFIDPFEMQLEPDSGDGFIHCITIAANSPQTTWEVDGDGRARPMDEEVPWPAGTFNLSFTVAAPNRPPPPLPGLVVRPGLATIVLVDYDVA